MTRCASCQTSVGPLVAGPLPGLRVCGVRFKDRHDEDEKRLAVEACGKRRSILDAQRYPVIR